jgi:hypothetical protein
LEDAATEAVETGRFSSEDVCFEAVRTLVLLAAVDAGAPAPARALPDSSVLGFFTARALRTPDCAMSFVPRLFAATPLPKAFAAAASPSCRLLLYVPKAREVFSSFATFRR